MKGEVEPGRGPVDVCEPGEEGGVFGGVDAVGVDGSQEAGVDNGFSGVAAVVSPEPPPPSELVDRSAGVPAAAVVSVAVVVAVEALAFLWRTYRIASSSTPATHTQTGSGPSFF